jgi:hypothetical protein
VRAVTHYGITREDVDAAVRASREALDEIRARRRAVVAAD